jgi:SAM-dependent methyltransferase
VLPLFALTVFVSAFLLFLVQPMFARMALPLLGGSPAVWNTALVFYQGVLLLGYGYAHLSLRLGVRRQRWLQIAVLAAAAVALPLRVPGGWLPPEEGSPVGWLLLLLAVSIGLPFFVVSSGAPVLQRWFAAAGHRQSRDPYFLYAASNAGSLAALIAYPLLLEPFLSLGAQAAVWGAGYAALGVLCLACAVSLGRRPSETVVGEEEGEADPEESAPPAPVTAGRALRWVAWAAVPASLMAGVNTYISNEIAALPLLWILPLGLYLVTFILAFARRQAFPDAWVARMLVPLVCGLVLAMVTRTSRPLALLILLHLAVFFLAALLCHRRLANDRPGPADLTRFYLWLSVGGVVGGAFNALLAPFLFRSIAEYPVALVAACLVARIGTAEAPPVGFRRDVFPAVLVGGLAANLVVLGPQWWPVGSTSGVLYAGPLLLTLLLAGRPVRFGLCIAAVLAAGTLAQNPAIHTERSFFGAYKVSRSPNGRYHFLTHGNTLHGQQEWDPPSPRALTYYYPTGPIGVVLTRASRFRSVGVVGLGAGTLAAYARPGQRWTFYEIDPAVQRIAEDPRLFTYLRDARAPYRVVLGDARLSLRAAGRGEFDLLVLDAYSSDAVPIHLLTREALQLYLEKLAPGGVLAFHISNRHFDLDPVLAALARDLGLASTACYDSPITDEEDADGKSVSDWVFLARRAESLRPWSAKPGWGPPVSRPGFPVWTDDYANALAAFRRR